MNSSRVRLNGLVECDGGGAGTARSVDCGSSEAGVVTGRNLIPPGDGLGLIELERGEPVTEATRPVARSTSSNSTAGQVAAVEAGFARPGLRAVNWRAAARASAGAFFCGDEGGIGVPVGDAYVERNAVRAGGRWPGFRSAPRMVTGFAALPRERRVLLPGALGPDRGSGRCRGSSGTRSRRSRRRTDRGSSTSRPR